MKRPGVLTLTLLLGLSLVLFSGGALSRDWADKPWLKQAKPFPGSGQTISLRTAYTTTFLAYLAGPRDAEQAVLILHDRWGMNRHVTAWADRLADEGYLVLAVDLYDSREVQRDRMGTFVWNQIDPVWIEANLDAAMRFLGEDRRRVIVSAFGISIGSAAELTLRQPEAVGALLLYPDPESRGLVEALPWMPAPLFRHDVERSPLHLRADRATPAITDEAFEATRQFLADAADARRR